MGVALLLVACAHVAGVLAIRAIDTWARRQLFVLDATMRLWHILHTRLRSVIFRGRRESDLREELQFHLEREAERLEAAGLRPDAARLQARRTFGAVEAIKEACRDARGTVLFDSVVRDVRFAVRSFRRAPLLALTIVTTVGLGLGLVAAVFTLLNAQVFQVDAVRNPHELFAVERQRPAGAEPERFTGPEYDALVRETDVFSDAFATRSGTAFIEGRRMEGPLVTGNYFQVLGVSAAHGRTLVPADDEPGSPPVMVISHQAWQRHYAGDPGVLERPIRVNGASFQIVGVMPEEFRGLSWVAPEFWAPLSLEGELGDRGELGRGSGGISIVGRLRPGLSRDQALAQLRTWDARRAAEGGVERPAVSGAERRDASLVLEPRTGTVPLSAEILLPYTPLFFAFGLILLIGCANVANLLFARGVGRQRELGIRLAIGASRPRVIWQLLTESLLLALVSAVLGYGVSRLVLTTVVSVATSTFPTEVGHINIAAPSADWRVALFLACGAVASTLFFALAPALQTTRLELVRAVRGEVVRDGRPGRARDALVVVQVTGSALLLILAAIFLRSSWASATIDPGIRTAGVVTVSILDDQRRGTILDVVNGDPSVVSVAASFPAFLGGLGGFPARADVGGGPSPLTAQFVSPEFFDVLGIDLLRGRNFTPTERSADAAVAIVSERVASELWPGADAVGQVLRVEPDPAGFGAEQQAALAGADGTGDMRAPDGALLLPRAVDVVGVVRDFAGIRLGGFQLGGAGVYMPTNADTTGAALTMLVRGDAERARRALVERLAAIDPNMSEVSTMETIARAEAYFLGIPFWLTLVLGVLALLLTLSGLFSVLSYLVEQRTQEIGVRMALGATRGGIAALVLSQSARPVAIGLLVGTSFTASLGGVLLATPAAELIGSSVRLFDPVAYAAGLLWIVGACACAALIPTLRAVRIDPVGALRRD